MDYSVLALGFGVDVLVCLALFKLRPRPARVWFCLGGSVVGLYLALFFEIFLIYIFITDGWFGVAIWLGPILGIFGGAAGYCVVHWWTEPAQTRP